MDELSQQRWLKEAQQELDEMEKAYIKDPENQSSFLLKLKRIEVGLAKLKIENRKKRDAG